MDNEHNQQNRGGGSRGDRDSHQNWQRSERDDGSYHQRGGRGGSGRGRGRDRDNNYNKQYNRYENQHYRDDRGGYNRNPRGGGFGLPSNHRQKYQSNEYDNRNANYESQRSRPHSKQSADHMRDASPDRNDRARAKDRLHEDHKRDPSPDRSSNEPYSQDRETQRYNTQNQYDQNFPSCSQGQHGSGSPALNMHTSQGFQQQGPANYNSDFGGQWPQEQGKHRHHGHERRDHDRNERSQDFDRGNYRRQGNWEENSDVRLSKALSFLLRHGAEKQGYTLMPGGFLYVEDILYYQRNLQGYTLEDIQRIVQVNDKQRFHMEIDKETEKWKIRANQGHTVQVEDLDLKPLVSKDEAPEVIHGTYMASWEKIKNTGLSRMGRNHIHFAAGEPGENGVISGMRSSCEVMIYIDLQKALQDGFKFFRSANNVILCAGNEQGVIPPSYFQAVVQRYQRQRLDFDKDVKITKIPVGGESLAHGNKNKKKKKKKGKGEKEDGTESKSKKEKMEVDEDAVESTANLFSDEPKESDDKLEQGPVKSKLGDDEDVYQDAVQNQDAVQDQDDFQDAEDSSDVHIESSEELLLIDGADTSISALHHLDSCEAVAVQCYVSEDSITKIVCTVKDRCFTFDLGYTPDIMTGGKLSDFFNFNKNTVKVFHGLDSPTCAIFFEKFNIILDGTRIFDLKVAHDLMISKGLGNVEMLKQTGYNPDLTPPDDSDMFSSYQTYKTYLKGYTYLSKVLHDDKEYKKQLFQMVNKNIDKGELKRVKEQRKREAKEANKGKGKK